MPQFFQCFNCRKVFPLFEVNEKTICPFCESVKVEAVSREEFDTKHKAGVFFNIDPKTGERAKKKKR